MAFIQDKKYLALTYDIFNYKNEIKELKEIKNQVKALKEIVSSKRNRDENTDHYIEILTEQFFKHSVELEEFQLLLNDKANELKDYIDELVGIRAPPK